MVDDFTQWGGSRSQITCRWPDKNPSDIFTASVLKWAFPGIQTGEEGKGRADALGSGYNISHHGLRPPRGPALLPRYPPEQACHNKLQLELTTVALFQVNYWIHLMAIYIV